MEPTENMFAMVRNKLSVYILIMRIIIISLHCSMQKPHPNYASL